MMDAYNLSGNTVRLEEAIDSVEVTWAFGAMASDFIHRSAPLGLIYADPWGDRGRLPSKP